MLVLEISAWGTTVSVSYLKANTFIGVHFLFLVFLFPTNIVKMTLHSSALVLSALEFGNCDL